MADQFLGEIRATAFNFAPTGWALCAGQLLPISQNTALFSLLGTFYGGDGKTTFQLPDLRSRVPLAFGQGPGLSPYDIGEIGGVEAVTLLEQELPSHNHLVQTSTNAASALQASGNHPAVSARKVYGASSGTLAADAIGAAGQGFPHNNLQPFLTVNYIIALTGIYPSRG